MENNNSGASTPLLAPKPNITGPKPPPIGEKPKKFAVVPEPIYGNAPMEHGVIKPRPPPNPKYPPINVNDFPSYAQKNFDNNNEGFGNQFRVSVIS